MIAVGYRAPEQSIVGAASVASVNSMTSDQPAVNDVVATNIAASVAQTADLAVSSNVTERAVSTRIQSEFQNASSDTSTISKPAIVQLSSASRNITTYTVKAADTVSTVAAKYNLSPETIRWANSLVGDTIAVGSTLQILPTNGIAYTVKGGDTVDSLAQKYKASTALITTYNDLEINGLTTGLKIIIPNGVPPLSEQPGYAAPSTQTNTAGTILTGYSAGYAGNKTWFIREGTPNLGRYAFGNCTAYAYDRRLELGRPVGTMWGNALTWPTNALSKGYVVDRNPAAGAVIQDTGHVGIVEAVLPNGDLQLSEMNATVPGGGFNIVSGRILPASKVSQYLYIH